MEVATAVLYLQASFMTAGHDDEIQAAQSSVLVQRLDAALHGAQSEPLEIWMEELYRQASDQQTMGSVVGELRITLGEAEKQPGSVLSQPLRYLGAGLGAGPDGADARRAVGAGLRAGRDRHAAHA